MIMTTLRSIREAPLSKKTRVLLRVDFNIPLTATGRIRSASLTRIRLALPTIQYILKKHSSCILVSHLGRPGGKRRKSLQMRPVAFALERLLKRKVYQLGLPSEQKTLERIQSTDAPAVFLLENIRFDPREEKNNISLAKDLARLADIYVNEAFSNSHRAHASMVAITRFLPAYAGFLLEREVQLLRDILHFPQRPFSIVIGGSKISTKLGLIRKFLRFADNILIGGAMANTLLKAKGIAVGKSLIEKHMVKTLQRFHLTNPKLHIPVDVVTTKALRRPVRIEAKAVGNVEKEDRIVDIGPDTVLLYSLIMKHSGTVVWNGPMGMIEYRPFQKGTRDLLQQLMKSRVFTVIGGGETLVMLNDYRKIPSHIHMISGGGAMLHFLENENLPALKPLFQNQRVK